MLPKNKVVVYITLFIFMVTLFPVTGFFNPKSSHAYDAGDMDHGHNGPDSEGPENTNPSGNRHQQESGDDPVNIANGNFIYRHQDLFISGRIPLEVSRTYYAQDMYEGPFGHGWSYNYYMTLTEVTEGSENYVIVRLADGKRLEFKDNGDGTYTTPDGYYYTLTKPAGYLLTTKNGIKYNFDSSGNLLSIVDRNTNQLTFSYDGSGKLTTVTGPAGRTLTLSYGSNNKIATITDSANRTFTYGYDADNNLISYTDPAGNTTQYAYDSDQRMTSVTDPKAYTFLTNTYDSKDRITQQVFNGGTYNYYYYSGYTRVRNPRGYSTYYYYNDNGNPTRIRNAYGDNIYKTWDENMNLISLEDAKGYITQYTYDLMGNFLTVTDPESNVTTFTYDTTYNQVTSIKDTLDRVTSFEYDSNGNLLKITDALTNETTFTYDTNGDLLTTTNADGKTTTFTYDTYGYLTTITDALTNNTNFTYDILGNLMSVSDQNGNTTQYSYNQLNQITQITDALSNITKFTYDENSNRTSIVDAKNNTTAFTFNSYNQLTIITDALTNATSFTYDENGNTLTVTDTEGNTTTNEYDRLDRLAKVTDALTYVTEYTYDENGNLTSIKDAKTNTTTYTYNSLNHLTTTTYPDSSTETYGYDNVGNLTSKTDRSGDIITYAYDNLDRLTTKTYPDATQVTYAYDALSRLVSAVNSNSSISYSYDAQNRVIQVIQDTKTINYEYDGVGNRTKLTYPDSSYITYSYDALNRLDQIKNAADQIIADYEYDELSRRNYLDLINGTRATYQFDKISRLTDLTNKITATSAVISSFAYTYDNAGNRNSMTTTGGLHSYTYDNIYQLTNADYLAGYPSPDMTYNLDEVGNRISTVNGGTISYSANNMNQYTNVGGTSYTYDANGNLTSDGTNSYTYDYENRLIQAVTPTDTINYTYGPLGRRISKTYSTGTTKFFYDGYQVIMETDDVGTATATYTYGTGIDEVLSMTRGGSTYYYQLDGLGNIKDITNSSGAIVEKYKYDVYGQPFIFDGSDTPLSESAIGNSYMFTGRRFDKESELYYYRARYYDAEIGRFMNVDPIGYAGGMNFYSYVGNNPIIFIDPLGLEKQEKTRRWRWGPENYLWRFLKGAHETVLGFIEMLPGITYEHVEGLYAYEGYLRASQSYWEGRATYTFSGGLIENVIMGKALTKVGFWAAKIDIWRAARSGKDFIKASQMINRSWKHFRKVQRFNDIVDLFEKYRDYLKNHNK